jgi:hypothetical protein
MYGIYEVVVTGVTVERKLRHEYGVFATQELAQKVAETLGERYSADEVTVG